MKNPMIKFDLNHNLEIPTLVLCKRNGDKIGPLNNVQGLSFIDSMTDARQFSFQIDKKHTQYFNDIKNFRLILVPEADDYYQISLDLSEGIGVTKSIIATHLPEAELSQTNIYLLRINTKEDIARENYSVNIFYNEEDIHNSILHRVLSYSPNFEIGHVDITLHNMNREFEFDGTDTLSALHEIGEEIGCYFKFETITDERGIIHRIVNAYDIQNACMNTYCPYYAGQITDDQDGLSDFKLIRYREENMTVCPKCGGTNIHKGYGVDTTVFFSVDNVADEIILDADTDSVKNCFHLEAGDDLMTSAVINMNPAGSPTIAYFPQETRNEMSSRLQEVLEDYDNSYKFWDEKYDYHNDINQMVKDGYNVLVDKYRDINKDTIPDEIYHGALTKVPNSIIGFKNFVTYFYDANDFYNYLKTSLMPSPKVSDTSAEKQGQAFKNVYVNASNPNDLRAIGVNNFDSITLPTADSFVQSTLRYFLDSRYQASIIEERDVAHTVTNHLPYLDYLNSYGTNVRVRAWHGSIKIENIATSKEEDEEKKDQTILSGITLYLCDDYESYIKDLVEKKLKSAETDNLSIGEFFQNESIKDKLPLYGLSSLTIFRNACNVVLDTLIQKGTLDAKLEDKNATLVFDKIYAKYYDFAQDIDIEVYRRELEIITIEAMIESIKTIMAKTAIILDIENCIKKSGDDGDKLWSEYVSFRRDQEYTNSNFKSDGLSNAEISKRGRMFLDAALKELKKAAVIQHTISASFKNIFTIKEFNPILDYFELGNWIRVQANDEIYKLRIVDYTLDFESYQNCTINFSDVIKDSDGVMSEAENLLASMSTMATSFSYLEHQADLAKQTTQTLNQLINNGIDITLLGDKNAIEDVEFTDRGLIAKAYNDIDGIYSNEQFKITHNVIAFTTDNWAHVTTSLGKHRFTDIKKSRDNEGNLLLDNAGRVVYVKDASGQYQFEDTVSYGLNANYVRSGVVYGSDIIAGNIFGSRGKVRLDLDNEIIEYGDGFKYSPDGLTIQTKEYSVVEDNGITHVTIGNIGSNGFVDISSNGFAYVYGGKNAFNVSANGASGNKPYLMFGDNNDVSTVGAYSAMIGNGLLMPSDGGLAIGRYNKGDVNSLFEIGVGSSTLSRANAFQVDKSGNLVIQGDLTIKGTVSLPNVVKDVTGSVINFDNNSIQSSAWNTNMNNTFVATGNLDADGNMINTSLLDAVTKANNIVNIATGSIRDEVWNKSYIEDEEGNKIGIKNAVSNVYQAANGWSVIVQGYKEDLDGQVYELKQSVIQITTDAITSYVSASNGEVSSRYDQEAGGFTWEITKPIPAVDTEARADAASAKQTAENASGAASSAAGAAAAASQAALDAADAAAGAAGIANEAKQAADEATEAAASALEDATQAASAADEAKGIADSANQAAANASGVAANAQSAADSASQAAQNAQNEAEAASGAAAAAQDTADQAKQDAVKASKTATDFLNFGDFGSGLTVGRVIEEDGKKSLSGNNAFIDVDGFHIRDNKLDNLASFTTDGIDFFNGYCSFEVSKSNDYLIIQSPSEFILSSDVSRYGFSRMDCDVIQAQAKINLQAHCYLSTAGSSNINIFSSANPSIELLTKTVYVGKKNTVTTNLNVNGDLSVSGSISGSFSVASSNITSLDGSKITGSIAGSKISGNISGSLINGTVGSWTNYMGYSWNYPTFAVDNGTDSIVNDDSITKVLYNSTLKLCIISLQINVLQNTANTSVLIKGLPKAYYKMCFMIGYSGKSARIAVQTNGNLQLDTDPTGSVLPPGIYNGTIMYPYSSL